MIETMTSREDNNGIISYTFQTNPIYPSRTNIITIPHGQSIATANMAMINMGYGFEDRWGFLPCGVLGSPEEYYFDPGYNTMNQFFQAYSDGTNFKIDFVVDKNDFPEMNLNVNGLTFEFYYYNFLNPGK